MERDKDAAARRQTYQQKKKHGFFSTLSCAAIFVHNLAQSTFRLIIHYGSLRWQRS